MTGAARPLIPAGALLAYVLLVEWQVFGRGAFLVVYNPIVGWLIRFCSKDIEATTIGARCYMARPNTMLNASGLVHERFHYEQQWRAYPLTFLPRYFWLLALHGYGCHPMEEAARKAAGEPSECPA